MTLPADPVLHAREKADAPVLSAEEVAGIRFPNAEWARVVALADSHEALRAQLTAAQQEREELLLPIVELKARERVEFFAASADQERLFVKSLDQARTQERLAREGEQKQRARAEAAEALCRAHAEEVGSLRAENHRLQQYNDELGTRLFEAQEKAGLLTKFCTICGDVIGNLMAINAAEHQHSRGGHATPMTETRTEAQIERCGWCGKPKREHYSVNFADGPMISGEVLVCPSSIYKPLPSTVKQTKTRVK